ncbi:MAG: LysR substrate-binding domain-containing protein [Pigmentiphaga sp.]|nr:LysR substrate-binding domain-containing protein [Pigmentiphaga sp.]MDX3906098.1 LysR substrate-binding domain-containing protein [Pigmentiphaga sp.]
MEAGYRVPSVKQIRSRLRLRHLDLLEALHATHSVHKAAARLGMTQPAASKLLAELENAFGVPLFTRSPRGITPTAYGTTLAQKAAVLLADLDGARHEIEALTRGATGRVRAGVLQVVLPVLVPRALARMHAAHAGVTVMLQEGTNDLLLAALARGELDCIIGRLMQGAAQAMFRTEVLYQEPIYVVARVGHPLARSTRVTAATLARQSWILPPPMRRCASASMPISPSRASPWTYRWPSRYRCWPTKCCCAIPTYCRPCPAAWPGITPGWAC